MISFAITVCNEHKELERLLNQLTDNLDDADEIVVLGDQGNVTDEVKDVINTFYDSVFFYQFPLNNHFGNFKNYLNSKCEKEWIIQIDADEFLNDTLLENLHDILELNNNIDVILVPRINTVEGLTQEHIEKWNWSVNDRRWINWPNDYQWRIYKNIDRIYWVNPVHERLEGYETISKLPAEEEFCFYHPKTIERQEKQNEYYETIVRK